MMIPKSYFLYSILLWLCLANQYVKITHGIDHRFSPRDWESCSAAAVFPADFTATPQAVPALADTCEEYASLSCCTTAYANQIQSQSDQVQRALLALLPNPDPSCWSALKPLRCAPCSPYQDTTMQAASWAIDFSVCDAFCEHVYTQCAEVVTSNHDSPTVAEAYANANMFCAALLTRGSGSPPLRIFLEHDEGEPGAPCISSDRECTEDDYEGKYTVCNDQTRTRSYVYELIEGVQCAGGAQPPAPLQGLPCGIECLPGYYLKPGDTQCTMCEPGTFSLGGGVLIEEWNALPTRITANTYCEDVESGAQLQDCGWITKGEYIRSGDIGDLQRSVLQFAFAVVRDDAFVRITANVDAEPNQDVLIVLVDGEERMRIYNDAQDYLAYEFPVSAGNRLFELVYEKDDSHRAGEDGAFVASLEVFGLWLADDRCDPCAPGSYASSAGSSQCTPCLLNTFAPTAGTVTCTACGESDFAYPGSRSCLPRQPCGEENLEHVYGACQDDGKREEHYDFADPRICLESEYTLPTSRMVDCAPCAAGMIRERGTCRPCPGGFISAEAGDTECVPCDPGTYAERELRYEWFEEIPEGARTGCIGDCGTEGWRFVGDHCDSGIGHGRGVDSWLSVPVFLEHSGELEFEYALDCAQGCRASFTLPGEYYTRSITGGPLEGSERRVLKVSLQSGAHEMRWTFHRYQTEDISRNDRLLIYSVKVSGIGERLGGGVRCNPCQPGSAASESASESCTLCEPGTYASTEGAASCVPCPENTASNVVGASRCHDCGEGTNTPEGSVECGVNACQYDAEPGVRYDLSAIEEARPTDMYGPIYDVKGHEFYLSVCSNRHSNRTCILPNGEAMQTFACQRELRGIFVDLGEVMGFGPLPGNAGVRDGIQVQYTGGTPGCARFYGSDIERSTTVNFRCDPQAGVGFPQAIEPVEPEDAPCTYRFEWASAYACPLCTLEADYRLAVGECTAAGVQTLRYLPVQQPPRCHDGEAVPPDEQRPCQTSTIRCPVGEYASSSDPTDEEVCLPAPPGYFSVGGGAFIYDWRLGELAEADFGKWSATPSGRELRSGEGTSTFSYVVNVVDEEGGQIGFTLKVSHGIPEDQAAGFYFTVDGKNALPNGKSVIRSTHLQYSQILFNLSPGAHVLRFTFRGGIEASQVEQGYTALIKFVLITGTSYAAAQPTPCPAGYHQPNEGSSTCLRCPANTYSPQGASECLACPDERMFSLPGASQCEFRMPCQAVNYQWVYGPCEDGVRTRHEVLTVPQLCDAEAPTAYQPASEPSTLSCDVCPSASQYYVAESDSCEQCEPGTYLDEMKENCLTAPAGFSAHPVRFYYGVPSGQEGADNLPEGWHSSCSGECAEMAWRAYGYGFDSGTHHVGELDSYLSFGVETVLDEGILHFDYRVVGGSTQNGLQLLIDGHDVRSLPYHPLPHGHDQREDDENDSDESGSAGEEDEGWLHMMFAVRGKGAHQIVFNYHQEDSLDVEDRSVVQLKDVHIEGDSTGGAFEIKQCPPGTAASNGMQSCDLCPAGTYSSSSGQKNCTPCRPGWYSAIPGSLSCDLCPPPASPVANQTDCAFGNDCGFASQRGFYKFSLLERQQNIIYEDSLVQFSLCEPMTRSSCGVTHSCVVNEGGSNRMDFGNIFHMEFRPAPGHSAAPDYESLYFYYTNGDTCLTSLGDSVKRQTKLNVYCEVGSGHDNPPDVLDMEDCVLEMEWYTIAGCPVCESKDYKEEETECNHGKKLVQMVRQSACNGPEFMNTRQVSCSKQVPFPWWAAVIALLGVFILIVGIVVVCIRHRHLQNRYELLINESESVVGNIDPEGNDDDHL